MQRIFIPGSEWLYFKIYTGHKSADEILTDIILPFTIWLKTEGLCDKFFFVRYSDPKFHIRLRFHVCDWSNYSKIFKEFYERIMPLSSNDNLIINIMCDTYKRELERYGVDTILDVEDIFCIDSEAELRLLKELRESLSDEDERWQMSLLLIDDILNVFGLEITEKIEIMSIISNSFKKEFGFTSNLHTKQLNDKYRHLRPDIQSTLKINSVMRNNYQNILSYRSNSFVLPARNINLKKNDNIHNIISSIIHMSMNRWFRSKNRLHEMVIYDFIFRYYKSENAILTYNDSI